MLIIRFKGKMSNKNIKINKEFLSIKTNNTGLYKSHHRDQFF